MTETELAANDKSQQESGAGFVQALSALAIWMEDPDGHFSELTDR